MRVFKRFACAFLSLLLLTVFPLTALASPIISLSPTSYVISLLLDACGLEVNTTALSSWVSNVTGYEEYVKLGADRQLGAYSQWIYDAKIAHQTEIDKARAEFQDAFGWIVDLGNAKWGDDITLADGALSRAYASIKEWLGTFPAYGTDNPDYTVPYALDYPYYANLKDSRTVSTFGFEFTTFPATDAYVIPSYYDALYYSIISLSKFRGTYYSSYFEEIKDVKWYEGSVYFNGKWYTYYYSANMFLSDYDKSVSYFFDIPVSDVMECRSSPPTAALEYYVKELLLSDLNLAVDSVNPDLQKTVISGLGNTISFPADEIVASEKLDSVDINGSLDAILKAITDAGLVLNPGIDIPDESETIGEGEDTDTKTTLAKILAKVEAIPTAIEAMFDRKLEPEDSDKDLEDMKMPSSIADKFPFCIPFDVIYLVKAMNASVDVPRFELPFEIHYQSFDYAHTFVVDMSEWESAVKILRTMLDLLFIAGLLSVTRDMIRG